MNKYMHNGVFLVFLTAIISGVSVFVSSFAIKGFDSSVFTFAKNIMVAVLLLSIILAFGLIKELKKLNARAWLMLALIGLVGGSIPFLLFFKGLQLSSGASALSASFIYRTLFVFAAVLAMLLLKERLDAKTIIGAALVVAGTYFMIRPGFELSLGVMLVAAATIFWAFENILAKKLLMSNDIDVSGTTVAFGRMFFGSLIILAYLVAREKSSMIFSMSSSQYIWIGLSAALLLAYVMTYYNGLKNTTVTRATSILALGAPITVLLSMIIGSSLSLGTALGIVLMTAGVIVMLYYSYILSFLSKLFENRDKDTGSR